MWSVILLQEPWTSCISIRRELVARVVFGAPGAGGTTSLAVSLLRARRLTSVSELPRRVWSPDDVGATEMSVAPDAVIESRKKLPSVQSSDISNFASFSRSKFGMWASTTSVMFSTSSSSTTPFCWLLSSEIASDGSILSGFNSNVLFQRRRRQWQTCGFAVHQDSSP